ncbi:MAG: hypothetical protein ACLS36_07010 [Streptococcus sp.]
MDLNKMMASLQVRRQVFLRAVVVLCTADFEKGNYGTNGIVGGGYALAVGAALTQQYKETETLLSFGRWCN